MRLSSFAVNTTGAGLEETEQKEIWLLLFSMFLRFLHVVARVSSLFHYIAEWYSFVLIYHICLSIYPVDGHFVCFQF